MSSYKLVIPPMTIHFCEDYPMRKKPVMAVSVEGENAMTNRMTTSSTGSKAQ